MRRRVLGYSYFCGNCSAGDDSEGTEKSEASISAAARRHNARTGHEVYLTQSYWFPPKDKSNG